MSYITKASYQSYFSPPSRKEIFGDFCDKAIIDNIVFISKALNRMQYVFSLFSKTGFVSVNIITPATHLVQRKAILIRNLYSMIILKILYHNRYFLS